MQRSSATVVCVDKTGTLTMNRMTVRELMAGDAEHTIDARPLPEVDEDWQKKLAERMPSRVVASARPSNSTE